MEGPSEKNVIVKEAFIIPFAKGIGFTFIFIIFDVLFIYLGESSIFFILQILNFAILIYIILRWYSDYYEISNEELTDKKGIIFSDKKVYLLKNIESVELKQGLLGKIFRLGNINLYLPKLRKTVRMNFISNPDVYLSILQSTVDQGEDWKGNY